ncbi:MAG: alpha/beta hydrolase fold protein [Enterovirga sp.]|nr:alpha/beta hydrolase fold protein [Enterovirga sp.]
MTRTDGLHYRVAGPSHGRALLFIHPLGADGSVWHEAVAILAERFACIVPDLRGAGSSPSSTVPVTLDEHIADLEGVRAELGLERVVPVGCAVGAMVAARYAARHIHACLALVAANAASGSTAAAAAGLRERAKALREGGLAAILPAAVERAFLEQPRDDRYRRYYDRFAAQDPEAYALSALAAADFDASGDLPRIRCPTLVLAGRHDVLLPPERAQVFADAIPGAKLVEIEDGAHFIPYQRPEIFARHVTDFLSAALGPAPSQPNADGVTYA